MCQQPDNDNETAVNLNLIFGYSQWPSSVKWKLLRVKPEKSIHHPENRQGTSLESCNLQGSTVEFNEKVLRVEEEVYSPSLDDSY